MMLQPAGRHAIGSSAITGISAGWLVGGSLSGNPHCHTRAATAASTGPHSVHSNSRRRRRCHAQAAQCSSGDAVK